MIDPSLIKFLQPNEQTELRTFEKFFETDGWKIFKKQLAQGYEMAISNLLNADTWADNRYQKGAAAAYQDVLAAEERVVTKFTALAEQRRAEQLTADEDAELEYE